MRNRAKCKLCGETIESFARVDYCECKCGEIAVVGGEEYYGSSAKDYINFLRVDDEGNEIKVKYEARKEKMSNDFDLKTKPTRKELIEMLDGMIESMDRLPVSAMTAPITHADHYSLILLLSSIFRSVDSQPS